MVFYLIGLGLDLKSISLEALEIIKKCKQIYLENYTVDFPYKLQELEKTLNTKITSLARENTESEEILKQSKKQDIALLVYGNPLSATTHIQLIISAKKQKIKFGVFHNSSILTAVAETGLQLYKFGKTASMPDWKTHTNKPTSFVDYIKQNQLIKAHTLLLTDIGLPAKRALEQLEQAAEKENLKLNRIIIHSNAGTSKSKIYYGAILELKKIAEKIKLPFCIIIPSDLHFAEQEALDVLKKSSI